MSKHINFAMASPKSLTQNEISTFSDVGFTKINHPVFKQNDYEEFKNLVEEILRENGNKKESTAIGVVHFKKPEILFWLLSDNILDICEDLLGPNVGLLNSTVFYKKAHTVDKAYWHTDTSRIASCNLFENPQSILNLIFSFTKTDISNGCLRYVPGSHRQHYEHNWNAPKNDLITKTNSIPDEAIDLSTVQFMELNENEASAHNVNVVHGSEPNKSDRDRIILSCRFFSASSRCNVENFVKNDIFPKPYLVRGHDVANSQLTKLFLK